MSYTGYDDAWLALHQKRIKAQARVVSPAAKQSKYKNKPAIVDGLRFASQKEAKRYAELVLEEKAGNITHLRCQAPYTLLDQFIEAGKTHRAIRYVADFTYMRGRKSVVEDVKGAKTQIYLLKRRLMLQIHGIVILET